MGYTLEDYKKDKVELIVLRKKIDALNKVKIMDLDGDYDYFLVVEIIKDTEDALRAAKERVIAFENKKECPVSAWFDNILKNIKEW